MLKSKRDDIESEAVIFDFDGTLIDSYTQRKFAHLRVCKFLSNYLDKKRTQVDQKIILKLISKIEIEMSDKMEWNRNVWWREVLKRCVGRNIQVPSTILTDASLIYWNTINERSFLYPGIKNFLQTLKQKGALLGLLSDTDGLKGMKSKRIADSGLTEFFDAILIAGEDTKEVKPHKQPFIKIAKLLGVPPEKCIFVGDNPNVDVAGVKELGMKTIIVGDNSSFFRESVIRPDFFIKRKNINELIELITSTISTRKSKQKSDE
ncbi:MAG: Phosphoglycolate phosphatase [Candidatus Argoarchaeum ethanivorans]|uniref:Phosphoglycolate phosphatase n=1 Tax=Candidatus Argoarchaeum ethanivorans TaxID=2608793 RepID=A0A811T775_9EURY|nr:MAG: Phosphoglycolate phosphatase [Candidatus Argoarchaeum ethanivorans]